MSIYDNKILLIGPLLNKNNPTITGGAIVLFNNLLEEFNANNVDYLLIDTNKENYTNLIIAYISIYIQIFLKQFQVTHISLHSSRDYLFFAPYVILLGRFFSKPTSLRKFGGEALTVYKSSTGIKKKILSYIFRNIDFLFLEMKNMVDSFSKLNKHTFWFPNVRKAPKREFETKEFSKKFVFISQIFKEKGIDEILEASKNLPKEYTIDLYGPIKDIKYSEEYLKEYSVCYCGALDSENVLATLKKYDVLLLPTYYKGEGYPGIVIESYSVGIPVIVTNLTGLSEITEHKKTGLLIEPKNIDALVKAMLYFNKENYPLMTEYAKEKFSSFNSYEQTKKFLEIINQTDRDN